MFPNKIYNNRWKNQPPPPTTFLPTSKQSDDDGHRLMSLVKYFEKENNNDSCLAKLEELIEILQKLIELYSRRGLLQGNSEKAEKLLEKNIDGASATMGGSSRRGKRGRQHNQKDGRNLSITEQQSTGDRSATATMDECLVLTAVVRILGGHSPKKVPSFYLSSGGRMILVIVLAADLCTSICEYIKAIPDMNNCALAEYELIANSGKSILTGLVKTTTGILLELMYDDSNLSREKSDDIQIDSLLTTLKIGNDNESLVSALHSCLRAIGSLVSMFGTKLARSSALLSDIQCVGWVSLTVPDHEIQRAASTLLSTMTLVGGGSDKMKPSDLWTGAVMDAMVSMSALLVAVAPPFNKQLLATTTKIWNVSTPVNRAVNGWLEGIKRDMPKQETRSGILRFLVSGLACYLRSLFVRDYLDEKQQPAAVLVGAKLNVDHCLDLVETMLSFPVASESLLVSTRKRLRNEPTAGGGLLSPSSLALDGVASHVKLMGHELLESILNSIGESVLLPYARRIMKLSYSALLTSSSGALRKVLEPAGCPVELLSSGSKRRWLHTSISARIAAIQTFTLTVLSFGSDPSSSCPSSSPQGVNSKFSSDIGKSMELVVGCLLEQLVWNGQQNDDWGSITERIDIATTAADSLDSTLLSCGGYMPVAIRSLIDSSASTGLSLLMLDCSGGNMNHKLCSYAALKVALLRMSCSCVCTPWPDGASSSIVKELKQVARNCSKLDGDVTVRREALRALRLCDSLDTPRVPALHFVFPRTGATNHPAGVLGLPAKDTLSIETLVHGLQIAQNESGCSEEVKQDEKARRREAAIGTKTKGVATGAETDAKVEVEVKVKQVVETEETAEIVESLAKKAAEKSNIFKDAEETNVVDSLEVKTKAGEATEAGTDEVTGKRELKEEVKAKADGEGKSSLNAVGSRRKRVKVTTDAAASAGKVNNITPEPNNDRKIQQSKNAQVVSPRNKQEDSDVVTDGSEDGKRKVVEQQSSESDGGDRSGLADDFDEEEFPDIVDCGPDEDDI